MKLASLPAAVNGLLIILRHANCLLFNRKAVLLLGKIARPCR
jgi:hypothetical protein